MIPKTDILKRLTNANENVSGEVLFASVADLGFHTIQQK